MLIHKNFVYLELQKTGCTHTRRILQRALKDNIIAYGKHETYSQAPSELIGDFSTKTKIGNIRNPWDWYVSLWAYGCMQQGGLYARVTKGAGLKKTRKLVAALKNPSLLVKNPWLKVYEDSSNPTLFQQWLKLIFTKGGARLLGEGYGKSRLSNYAGLLTYRYLRLYTPDTNNELSKISSHFALKQYDADLNFMNVVIKNEEIEPSLLSIASYLGVSREIMQEAIQFYEDRTNASVRNPYKFYYNSAARNMIEQRERFIIEKYHYNF